MARTYDECVKILKDIGWNKSKPGLERIEKILKALGNPHDSLKIIHVAGTNGKGSTCAYLSTILQKADYKVGMFTSPFLKKANEEIRINDHIITDDEFAVLFDEVYMHYTDQSIFELMTAMAFLFFRKNNVNYAIVETGMGGRLDSTNIIDPILTVITSISLDHTQFLGKNLEKVTAEKAAIIKTGVPCITYNSGIAMEIITKVCNDKSSELIIPDPESVLDYTGKLGLRGSFQKINASLAIAALKKILPDIDDGIITKGLEQTRWPARLEWIDKNIVIDCAHNPDAVHKVINELRQMPHKKKIAVFGALADKEYKDMAETVADYFDHVILTRPASERALDPGKLVGLISGSIVEDDPYAALDKAKTIASENDLIIIFGSCALSGLFTRQL